MKKKILISGIVTFIMVLLFAGGWLLRIQKNASDIAKNQIQYDNGDMIYRPEEGALFFDAEQCVLYYNNLLSVYLLSDLSDEERMALADSIGGKVVGNTSGCINYMQIKVDESSFEELNSMADSICQSEHVLYASYDSPMLIQSTTIDDNPWSDNVSNPEEHRGEENNPDGNDWWAEAIGAYTAWEYVDSHVNDLKPIKVGVIDGGFFTEHEDLQEKIEILGDQNIPYKTNEKGKFEADSHGTAVAGIIAANNNSVGMRGIANDASLVCADWSLFDEDRSLVNLLSTGQYVEITKQMIEKGCKVINCSFGVTLPSKETFERDKAVMDLYPILSAWLNNYSYDYTYDNILLLFQREAELRSIESAILMIELLLNEREQFLIVQSAGNGYGSTLDLPGYDSVYTGYYCGITEDLFNQIFESKDNNEFLKECGITYQAVDEHLLIVGGTGKQNDENGRYFLLPGSGFGRQVDICAPGERISVLGIVENGISTYEFPSKENISTILPCGTSFSAPMVSGAAALLWSIDPNLTASQVRDLLLLSNHNAVGVGADAGTIYPMLNIGESVKNLTGWSNYTNIQEGLYIVPGTQNILYVEQDEDEISFTAWWFKLASIEETVKLDGNDAEFVCGEDDTGQTFGKMHFENSQVILTLDDNRFPYLAEQTEYSWLREDLWKLSEEQLREIGKALNVPENLKVEYTQAEAYYWDVGGRYLTYVQILFNGDVIAVATVDSFTGELIRDMVTYSDSHIQSSAENIPDGVIEKYGHTYYIFDVDNVTSGHAAIDFCKSRGGHLATITSEEENEFLFNFMLESGYQNAYFGFSDSEEEGDWKWLNGETVLFTNWHGGEPNGGLNENYAMFYERYPDGTWNDGGCANSRGEVFICEWE